ncbi:oleoyl-coa acyltransferase [Anaeramoeba flamelloides]|uniref:Oleoyl-coa acyltransferase n=1 Tax=Anaeramoeba flamelloides TaxID=1746091 RepID=A0AAV7ZFZ6_9EUKA|nr:oleoyl-coa acyltransferase [Anaeramoeba flamelloides]
MKIPSEFQPSKIYEIKSQIKWVKLLATYLVSPILSLIRLTLFVPIFVLFYASGEFFKYLRTKISVSYFQKIRIIERVVLKTLAYLILFIFGVFKVQFILSLQPNLFNNDLRKERTQKNKENQKDEEKEKEKEKEKRKEIKYTQKELIEFTTSDGDLIISNHISILEIFFLTAQHAPVFTGICKKAGNVVPITAGKAVIDTLLNNHYLNNQTDCVPFSDLIGKTQKQFLGPIVVFPEGTTSNGKSLLQFTPVFENWTKYAEKDSESSSQIIPICFKCNRNFFTNKRFVPIFTLGNSFRFLYNLCSQPINKIKIIRMHPQSIPFEPLKEDSLEKNQWAEELRAEMCNVFKLKSSKIGANDKYLLLGKL